MAAGSAHAITVSGLNPNSNSYLVSAGSFATDYSGVAELTLVRSDLGAAIVQCSGALLADGVTVLTAANCIADSKGAAQATAASVTFTLPSGLYQSGVMSFHVNPRYDGSAQSPDDIALLTLDAPAPSTVARYQLYTGNALDQTFTLAGYGFGGTGAAGYNSSAYSFGTLRVGENQYDAPSGTGDLLFDFDDGTLTHDALGGSPGMSSDEAFIAPGDAGGPSFINGQIAGVHSYSARILPNGNSVDIDSVLNSSFGEYAGDVSVSLNAAFIQSLISTAPEPKTMFLIGIALIAVSLMGDKRRQQ